MSESIHCPCCGTFPHDKDALNSHPDTELWDWLEEQAEDGMGWVARPSTTGRGYRLHQEPKMVHGVTAPTAREAARRARDAARKGEKP